MKNPNERFISDGQGRILRSASFAARKAELKEDLMNSRRDEIESSGWLKRKFILWRIDSLAAQKAKNEMCPDHALYLRMK